LNSLYIRAPAIIQPTRDMNLGDQMKAVISIALSLALCITANSFRAECGEPSNDQAAALAAIEAAGGRFYNYSGAIGARQVVASRAGTSFLLYLENIPVTDELLDNIASLTDLRGLTLLGTSVSEAQFGRLTNLSKMYALGLSGRWVSANVIGRLR